jgi:hypothetical protein
MSAIRRRSLVFISILSMASAHLSVGTAYGDISNELQGDIFKESRQAASGVCRDNGMNRILLRMPFFQAWELGGAGFSKPWKAWQPLTRIRENPC